MKTNILVHWMIKIRFHRIVKHYNKAQVINKQNIREFKIIENDRSCYFSKCKLTIKYQSKRICIHNFDLFKIDSFFVS